MHACNTKNLERLFGLSASAVRSLTRAGHISPLKRGGRLHYSLFEAHRVRADTTISTADAVEQLHVTIAAMRDQAARLQQREAAVDAKLRELDARLRQIGSAETATARRRKNTLAPGKSTRTVRPPPKRKAQKKNVLVWSPHRAQVRQGKTAVRAKAK